MRGSQVFSNPVTFKIQKGYSLPKHPCYKQVDILHLHFTHSQIYPTIISPCVPSNPLVELFVTLYSWLSCLLTPFNNVNAEAMGLYMITVYEVQHSSPSYTLATGKSSSPFHQFYSNLKSSTFSKRILFGMNSRPRH